LKRFETLDEAGWLPLLSEQMPNTFEWIRALAESPPETGSPRVAFLRGAMQMLWPSVVAQAKEQLGETVFNPQHFEDVAADLEELLRLGILPAQLRGGTIVDKRSLFLAGWFYLFSETGDEPANFASILANDSVQEFLAKAFEMSTIAARWGEL
jgi:hypothetical protein